MEQDNLGAQDQGSQDQGSQDNAQAQTVGQQQSGWKQTLNQDLRGSPLVQRFGDDIGGLENMIKSHHELEKVFSSHEKTVIPKGPEDVDGWNSFSKALGIPSKSTEYGLPDAALPESMKGVTINKDQFAEIVHAHKLTPAQAKGLWSAYQEIHVSAFNKAMESHSKLITENVNALKGEWGDAYENNVELGQMVINKFSKDQEMSDYLTATLSADPRGIRFLAEIGSQFAENKIGEFQIKRFSLAPEEASTEIDKIVRDPKHAYNNPKATGEEHQAAIDYVNSLYAILDKAKG